MKKYLFLVMLLVLMARPACAESVRTIGSPEELMAIANDPSGSFLLTADVDMAGIEWQPFDFCGTLDGAGYGILNLTISTVGENPGPTWDGNQKEYTTRFAGLFATIENAQIRDLKLINARSVLECDEPVFLGALAGRSLNSTIADCEFSGCLELRAHKGCFGLGGVVGYGSGDIDRCRVDMTLICTDTDEQTPDEQFLGGVYAAGFMGVSDCQIDLAGYDSEHGYVHNGGVTGMLLQYPLGSGRSVRIERNQITAQIHFFEHNSSRRAYCEPVIGEVLAWSHYVLDNVCDFQRDERFEYQQELRPEMCPAPEYSQRTIPPTPTTYGCTEYTCTRCGYTFRDHYVCK